MKNEESSRAISPSILEVISVLFLYFVQVFLESVRLFRIKYGRTEIESLTPIPYREVR